MTTNTLSATQEDLNAANDPGLRKMIKTASYTELEEWMTPDNPVNIYIAGETGLGKSSAVLHIRKNQGHPVVRVNLSYFTDIDDLIGGLRLENDATTFQHGPVTLAMQMENCTLLLDEVDQANPRVLMDIQPVLEGKGYLVKKTGKMIYPSKGFNVVATGNSKGNGDATGEYIGVNPLNKAFLDRFHITIEFKPPTKTEMRNILRSDCTGLTDEMIEGLSAWYSQILDAKEKGVSVETLSTRRMVNIGGLLLNRKAAVVDSALTLKCIEAGIKKYDEDVRGAFMNIWDIVSKDAVKNRAKKAAAAAAPNAPATDPTTGFTVDEDGDKVPF